MREFHETDDWGIAYVMVFCKPCNVMMQSGDHQVDHDIQSHPERRIAIGKPLQDDPIVLDEQYRRNPEMKIGPFSIPEHADTCGREHRPGRICVLHDKHWEK